jgi:hypothetical protein
MQTHFWSVKKSLLLLSSANSDKIQASIQRPHSLLWLPRKHTVSQIVTMVLKLHAASSLAMIRTDHLDLSQLVVELQREGWVLAQRQYAEYLNAHMRVWVHESNEKYDVAPHPVPTSTAPTTSQSLAASSTHGHTKNTHVMGLQKYKGQDRGCNRLGYRYGRVEVLDGHFKEECPWTSTNPDRWPVMPDTCNYISSECRLAHRLFGFPPNLNALSIADLMLLEQAFARYPTVHNIVDIGSAVNVDTTYLGLLARTRGGQLLWFSRSLAPPAATDLVKLDNMQIFTAKVTANSNAVAAAVKKAHCVIVSTLDDVTAYLKHLVRTFSPSRLSLSLSLSLARSILVLLFHRYV